ncbi:GNAT family N-acetyltransferase [Salinarimonas rosea]|uniref:GNAT family N-acetyltransferase n=1 Tax=Salinarimonas rosea TaxID=552063 RepID=UPI000416EECC|nr:GNAT family N-acetyltransferase [Salinarimonas rosea]
MTAAPEPLRAIEPLGGHHDVDSFSCGREALDRFLKRFALVNEKAGSTRTFVLCRGAHRVVGYYSLTVGSVDPAHVPRRVAKGLARHPIPVMLLARLAVDTDEQGRGVGSEMLRDALLRTQRAADHAGIRAGLVHAKDAAARDWYARYDFEPSPSDPYHLFMLLKDVRALLGR